MPRWIISAVLLLVALTLVPMGLVYRSRSSDKTATRIQVVYDMDDQAYHRSQSAGTFHADGRAMRLPPSGTIARGHLNESDAFYRGVSRDTIFVEDFPLPVTEDLMARGRERYDVFCAPCHGRSGDGQSAVHRRAAALGEGTWTPPTDLAGATVVERPVGHIYNTIAEGIRNMPAYGSQIPPRDRWAITAYVRALQLSRNASPDDLPADLRAALD